MIAPKKKWDSASEHFDASLQFILHLIGAHRQMQTQHGAPPVPLVSHMSTMHHPNGATIGVAILLCVSPPHLALPTRMLFHQVLTSQSPNQVLAFVTAHKVSTYYITRVKQQRAWGIVVSLYSRDHHAQAHKKIPCGLVSHVIPIALQAPHSALLGWNRRYGGQTLHDFESANKQMNK